MMKTEHLASYSSQNDYYQLWMEKTKENLKLVGHLLDSKKVIMTLHVKLSDILNYIKLFEVNQESINYINQEQDSTDGSTLCTSVDPGDNQLSFLPESQSDFVEMEFETENENTTSALQSDITIPIAQHLELPKEPSESQITTNHSLREPNNSNDEQVKDKISSKEKSERCGNLSMNVFECFKAEPLEMQDKEESGSYLDNTQAADTQVEDETSFTEESEPCGNLTMNVFEGFKTEPLEVQDKEESESYLENTTDNYLLPAPTESTQEMDIQVENETSSTEESERCGNLTMNVFECFKTEPLEVQDKEESESYLDNTTGNLLPAPTESTQEIGTKEINSSEVPIDRTELAELVDKHCDQNSLLEGGGTAAKNLSQLKEMCVPENILHTPTNAQIAGYTQSPLTNKFLLIKMLSQDKTGSAHSFGDVHSKSPLLFGSLDKPVDMKVRTNALFAALQKKKLNQVKTETGNPKPRKRCVSKKLTEGEIKYKKSKIEKQGPELNCIPSIDQINILSDFPSSVESLVSPVTKSIPGANPIWGATPVSATPGTHPISNTIFILGAGPCSRANPGTISEHENTAVLTKSPPIKKTLEPWENVSEKSAIFKKKCFSLKSHISSKSKPSTSPLIALPKRKDVTITVKCITANASKLDLEKEENKQLQKGEKLKYQLFCKDCGKSLSNKYCLQRHMKTVHNQTIIRLNM